MSKSFPLMVVSISLFCTVGCGGSSTTNVTPGAPASPGAPAVAPANPVAPADPVAPANPVEPVDNGVATTKPAPTLVWRVEASGRTEPLSAVWGSATDDVWAVGGHVVLHSRGDGAWTAVHEDAGEEYQTVFGADGWVYVGGYVCDAGLCQGGVLLRSSDGGATWSRMPVGAGVNGIDGDGGVVYANSGDLYGSRDHFATTEKLPLVTSTARGVHAGRGAVYVFGGERGAQIRRSTDGGGSWSTVYAGFSGSQSGYANAVVRGGNALFATVNGCYVPYCIAGVLRSDDDGATWREASEPQDYIAGAWAASDEELYVGGTHLLRSADGGAHFERVAAGVDVSIASVWGASAGDVYAVGNGGTIVHGTSAVAPAPAAAVSQR